MSQEIIPGDDVDAASASNEALPLPAAPTVSAPVPDWRDVGRRRLRSNDGRGEPRLVRTHGVLLIEFMYLLKKH